MKSHSKLTIGERGCLALLAMVVFVGICWVAFALISDKKAADCFHSIAIGMSEHEVLTLMGLPDRSDVDDGKKYNYYYLQLHPVHYEVVFWEDRVVQKEILSFP